MKMLPATDEQPERHKSQHWRSMRQRTAENHLAHYLQYAEIYDQAHQQSYNAFVVEHDNLLTGLHYAYQCRQTANVQRFAWALARPYGGYLSTLGYWTELADLITQTITLSEEAGEIEIAAAFRADLATLQLWRGDLVAAQENCQAALAILKLAQPIPSIQTAVAALHLQLGTIAQRTAVYTTARHHYQHALSLYRQLDHQSGITKALHQLGNLAVALGDLEAARPFYNESLALSQALGDESQIALTTWNLGNLAYREGQLTEAKQAYCQGLALFESLNDQRNKAGILHALGQVALDNGEIELARQYVEQSLAIMQALGHRLAQPVTLGLLGIITYAAGEPAVAETLFQQAIDLAEAVGDRREANSQRFNLAVLYELLSRLPEAVHLMQAVVVLDEQLGLPDLDKDRIALARVQEKAAHIG